MKVKWFFFRSLPLKINSYKLNFIRAQGGFWMVKTLVYKGTRRSSPLGFSFSNWRYCFQLRKHCYRSWSKIVHSSFSQNNSNFRQVSPGSFHKNATKCDKLSESRRNQRAFIQLLECTPRDLRNCYSWYIVTLRNLMFIYVYFRRV